MGVIQFYFVILLDIVRNIPDYSIRTFIIDFYFRRSVTFYQSNALGARICQKKN